jgi:NOL1/NOP2/fmu family ribosome biogenesis protein
LSTADEASQQLCLGEEYSMTQVACIEDSKNNEKLEIVSVIFEQWVSGKDIVKHTAAY